MKLFRLSIPMVFIVCIPLAFGCSKSKKYETHAAVFGIMVDDVFYGCSGMTQTTPDGQACDSALIVYPNGGTHATVGVLSSSKTKPGTMEVRNGAEIIQPKKAGYFTVYYIDDHKIVFSKSYEELGIDATEPANLYSESCLKPVLEKMIRENLASH